MAKSELGAKPRSPLILHKHPAVRLIRMRRLAKVEPCP